MTRAGGSSEVAQDVFAAGCAHALAQGRIVQQLQHALGQGGRVAWWDEKAGLAIQHGFRRAAAVGADHRSGAGHGLQIDHPEAFEVRAADDDVGGCEDALGVRAEAEIAQALAQQRVGVRAFQDAFAIAHVGTRVRIVAGDKEARLWQGLGDATRHSLEDVVPLHVLEAREQDDQRRLGRDLQVGAQQRDIRARSKALAVHAEVE